MKDSTIKRFIYSSTTVLIIFLLWIILSATKDNALIYPSIKQIWHALIGCFDLKGLTVLSLTIFRVIITIIASFLVSSFIMILYVKRPTSYAFFSPIIKIMRTVPFICISIFIILIFDRQIAPYVIAFLLTIPIICEGIKSGIDLLDKNLVDDLAMHNISLRQKIFLVYMPMLIPTIVLTFLQTFGLGFKVIIMGECYAQTKNSLGLYLFHAKEYLAMDELIAWTIVIVVIVAIVETMINYYNKKRNQLIY
ncbi:MAG: ABC transporter permease subunit [Bacilli bacterium]|nr:ABC transporter permease subunit [Bacilli bacterium]